MRTQPGPAHAAPFVFTRKLHRWHRLIASALFILTTLLLSQVPALAADPIQAYLNGRKLNFDVPPMVENGRTLVPVRAVLEPLGASVHWDPGSRAVVAVLGAREVRAVIGEAVATVNGQPHPLDATSRIVGERTLIPLRFFAESLGLSVQWEGESRTILIQGGEGDSSRSASARSRGGALVETARTYVGIPYAWGGTDPATGFDCSGFLLFLFRKFGIELPRTSFDQYSAGVPVARSDLMPGDLVFFTTYAAGPSHAGVYDGLGNFIHAGSESKGVQVTPLSKVYWSERHIGARRILR